MIHDSLAGCIQTAILRHYNGEGAGSLWETVELAVRLEFDVRRREAWAKTDPDTGGREEYVSPFRGTQ